MCGVVNMQTAQVHSDTLNDKARECQIASCVLEYSPTEATNFPMSGKPVNLLYHFNIDCTYYAAISCMQLDSEERAVNYNGHL